MVRDKGAKKSFGQMQDNQGDMEVSPFPPGEGTHGWAPDSGDSGSESVRGARRAFAGPRAAPGPTSGSSVAGAIYKPSRAARHVGQSINAKGNELALRKVEPGRIFRPEEGADRPVGVSTARFQCGVRPLESITTEHTPPAGAP